jgi:hypothetical protein
MARPHPGERPAVLLAVALLWSLLAAATVLGAAAAGPVGPPDVRSVDEAPTGLALQGFEADRTSFRITVYENGSAEWLFRYEKSLNASEREAFEAFAREFNDNETELFVNFRKRARWLTDNGSEATGREMGATAFRREARTEGLDPQSRSLGVVEMSFRWEGFAVVTEAGRVEAGDVFQGGLYIGPNQEIVYEAGPALVFVSALPDNDDRTVSGDTLADSDSVTWRGEKAFTDRRPRADFTTRDAEPGSTATRAGGTGSGSDPGLLLPVGALVVVAVLGAAAAVAYRSGALPSGDGGTAAGSGEAAAGGASSADGTAGPVGVPEAELLSDEERVVDLLEDNGGRMKQVDIVEATDWSKSKVSMLLSDMEEAERISKLRVGRENIVSLTGHEPDAAGSPFEDEQ